jgi:hypothetical protein
VCKEIDHPGTRAVTTTTGIPKIVVRSLSVHESCVRGKIRHRDRTAICESRHEPMSEQICPHHQRWRINQLQGHHAQTTPEAQDTSRLAHHRGQLGRVEEFQREAREHRVARRRAHWQIGTIPEDQGDAILKTRTQEPALCNLVHSW